MSNLQTGETSKSVVSRNKIRALTAAAIPVLLILLLAGSVITLRWINPSFSSFTLSEDWKSLDRERYSLREYWVSYDELPGHLKWAVIASEDQRFLEHFGLDWSAIEKALDERRKGERLRGASTITQQVAKNLYLWPGQSWFRKTVEAGIAILIEVFWTKDRILEVYLNIAEFGPGLYGAGKASSELFGKEPSELSPSESARMAAVLPNPKRMRVEPPSPYTEERSRWILQQMTQITGIAYLPEMQPDTFAGSADTLGIPTDERDPLRWDSYPVIWGSDSIDRGLEPNNWGVELDIDIERDYNFRFDFKDRLVRGTDIESRPGAERQSESDWKPGESDAGRYPDTTQQPLDTEDVRPSDTVRMPEDARQRDSALDLDSLLQRSQWKDPDLSIDFDSLFRDRLQKNRN